MIGPSYMRERKSKSVEKSEIDPNAREESAVDLRDPVRDRKLLKRNSYRKAKDKEKRAEMRKATARPLEGSNPSALMPRGNHVRLHQPNETVFAVTPWPATSTCIFTTNLVRIFYLSNYRNLEGTMGSAQR